VVGTIFGAGRRFRRAQHTCPTSGWAFRARVENALAPLAQYHTLTVKVQAIGIYRFIVYTVLQVQSYRPGIGREFRLRGPLPLSLFK